MVDGIAAKTQTTKTLHCMQTMARVQTQLQSRNRMKEEEVIVHRQQQQKCEKEMDKLKVRMNFISSSSISFFAAHNAENIFLKINIAC